MTFAQTIRAKRESLGLTQAEFAVKLMVSKQTVNNWECGRFEPSSGRKAHLLEIIGGTDSCLQTAKTLGTAVTVTTPNSASVPPIVYQRRRHPNVCEELEETKSVEEEVVAQPKIDFRRPPPHG